MIKRYALIIGISKYHDTEWNLKYARKDAEAIYDLFINSGLCGFDPENIILLCDEAATYQNVIQHLHELCYNKTTKDDQIYIYYSGHGLHYSKGRSADFYLATYDSNFKNPSFGNALHSEILSRHVKNSIAKNIVVIMDNSCSGSLFEKEDLTASNVKSQQFSNLIKEGVTILASSAASEASREDDKLQHGVFTHYFLEGILTGKAANKDGSITPPGIYDYLADKVYEKSGQHPVMYSRTDGAIIIAIYPPSSKSPSVLKQWTNTIVSRLLSFRENEKDSEQFVEEEIISNNNSNKRGVIPLTEDTDKVKILFLGANPSTTSRLRLDEEVKKIQLNLKLAKERDKLELIQEWAVNSESLMQAVLDVSPNISRSKTSPKVPRCYKNIVSLM